MAARIAQSAADELGFDIGAAVDAFAAALAAHALTIGEPAPVANSIVEGIVRDHGGQFEIYDDTPELTPAQKRSALFMAVTGREAALINEIMSPARRNLASIDFATISRKLPDDRTDVEAARMAEIQAAFARIAMVQRHAAVLLVEIEELSAADLDGWVAVGWPG